MIGSNLVGRRLVDVSIAGPRDQAEEEISEPDQGQPEENQDAPRRRSAEQQRGERAPEGGCGDLRSQADWLRRLRGRRAWIGSRLCAMRSPVRRRPRDAIVRCLTWIGCKLYGR